MYFVILNATSSTFMPLVGYSWDLISTFILKTLSFHNYLFIYFHSLCKKKSQYHWQHDLTFTIRSDDDRSIGRSESLAACLFSMAKQTNANFLVLFFFAVESYNYQFFHIYFVSTERYECRGEAVWSEVLHNGVIKLTCINVECDDTLTWSCSLGTKCDILQKVRFFALGS